MRYIDSARTSLEEKRFVWSLVAGCWALASAHCQPESRPLGVSRPLVNGSAFGNAHGYASTVSADGFIDLSAPFFRSFGTNGRTCATCHDPGAGWSITPLLARARFDATEGLDPLFEAVDGANCPNADRSTLEARSRASSLLLERALIRVALPIPEGADFELASSEGTYCNQVNAASISVFRRPLPATNLRFHAVVMWDGRESDPAATLSIDYANQSNGATLGHAEALHPLPDWARAAIVAFEIRLFSAQEYTYDGGLLSADGGLGGARILSTLELRSSDARRQAVFGLYGAWSEGNGALVSPGRAAIARGERIFNARAFRIVGVRGVSAPDLVGRCGTCHDASNIGTGSRFELFDLGLSDARRRPPELPLYTFRNRMTGEEVAVSDPGRALLSGRWEDMARFKVPSLRDLAARAPYFHDGSAPSLADVVAFYDARFEMGLTSAEASDLVAFLAAL